MRKFHISCSESESFPELGIQEIQDRIPLLDFLLPNWLEKAQIDLLLVGDRDIQEINSFRRGKDKPTDVLSFPLIDNQLQIPEQTIGEIIISWETLQKQAKEIGHSPKEEMFRLFVHGLLHCLGYDHETNEADAKAMRDKEDICLNLLHKD